MKNIQIILNAVLSKNIFEYVLVDKNFSVVGTSLGIKMYLGSTPSEGEDIFTYLPELVGSEDEIADIFTNPTFSYLLESVYKSDYYINVSVEHYNEDTVLVLLHNITDLTLSRKKLLQYSNESTLLTNTLQKILDQQNALLFVTHNNEISYSNGQFMEYFSIKQESDIPRRNLQIYKYLDSTLKSYDEMFDRVNSKEEYLCIKDDTFILQASLVESTHKLFTLTKVTKLSKEMQIDALTGVYKKSYFNTFLEKLIREEEEDGVVVVLDIDDFKKVNDTYGHQAGDDVLKEFANLIQSNVRGDDLLARWGGEEFLLLLKHTNLENALKKVESLREQVAAHTFSHIGHMTSSFGVAWKEADDDIHSLLQRADKALYEAKNAGKNRVQFKNI